MSESSKAQKEEDRRRPYDQIVRITRRKQRHKLRVIPNIPGVIRFFLDVVHETPFIPLLVTVIILWMLSSLGIYLIERPINAQFDSYGHALWWSFTAMQTQGANSPGPITLGGMVIGVVWSIIGTIAFFGVIIAAFYAYYVDPRRRPSKAIIDALQYNLEELENLSINELKAVKENVISVVDARIAEIETNEQDSHNKV